MLFVVCLSSWPAFSQIDSKTPRTADAFKRIMGLYGYEGYDSFYGDINQDGKKDLIYMSDKDVYIHYSVTDTIPTATKPRRVTVASFAPELYKDYHKSIVDINQDNVYDLVYFGKEYTFYYKGIKVPDRDKLEFSLTRKCCPQIQSNTDGICVCELH